LPNCGACQRFAALRVRNRILDVLRFGTPIEGNQESRKSKKNNGQPYFSFSAFQLFSV
jgi:uncharacterized protein (DUF2141 family)